MSTIIKAIYEDGVFKPLEEVDLKEHQKVNLEIIDDEWLKFDQIISKIQRNSTKYSPDEIESDIMEAIKEVREEHNVI